MAFLFTVPDEILISSIRLSFQSKLGKRKDGTDGNEFNQLIGIIGENSIRHLFNQPLMYKKDEHDNGVDLVIHGKKFDVKTMGRRVNPQLNYINNFDRAQLHFKPDAYIFTSLNKTNFKLAICGWITYDDLIQKMINYNAGDIRNRHDNTSFRFKTNTSEIPNSSLNYNFKNLAELDQQIDSWAQPEFTW